MKNIRITPAFVLLAAALICCENGGLIGALCAAVAAHEGGHLLLIRLWGGRVEQLTLGLGGMDIRYTCPRASYPKDAWIALAGPGANLLCCLLCAAPAQRLESEGIYLFLGCSGLLCLFNLLPALPLDGGVCLRALLLCRWEMERCDRALAVCGWCVGMALLAAGVLLCVLSRGNVTLLVCALFVLSRAGRQGRQRRKTPLRLGLKERA